MPVNVNLRHLESKNVQLEGEIPIEELEIDPQDEVIKLKCPLTYDLEAQQVEGAILVQGDLQLTLDCQCVRCLKDFQYSLFLSPWTVHVPLEGEDAAPVTSDCVDLTPYIREDILLEFPQHPLCDPECRGLPETISGKPEATSGEGNEEGSSAWAELNKLKL